MLVPKTAIYTSPKLHGEPPAIWLAIYWKTLYKHIHMVALLNKVILKKLSHLIAAFAHHVSINVTLPHWHSVIYWRSVSLPPVCTRQFREGNVFFWKVQQNLSKDQIQQTLKNAKMQNKGYLASSTNFNINAFETVPADHCIINLKKEAKNRLNPTLLRSLISACYAQGGGSINSEILLWQLASLNKNRVRGSE